ncbi:MAG TPA: Holliday junction branch migration protein RuvA [Acidimicrobiales bacterium]|nr:Holliday junction branch migration protein RuvA [Acidimicrobiales bacterium]
MIGSLRGTLLDRVVRSDHQLELLIEVGGVGYRVVVPAGGAERAGDLGSRCFLHVHTHVREDALVLYGFPTREERDCFELLLGAHGVGPAVAVALLSVLSPASLRRAVLNDDSDALTLVPGIGKKTAARLILELAPRFEAAAALDLIAGTAGRLPAAGAGDEDGATADGQAPHEASAADRAAQRDELRAALSALGYGADEVRQAVAHLPADGPIEELLRHALRELAGR